MPRSVIIFLLLVRASATVCDASHAPVENTDVTAPVRSARYPDGVQAGTITACCSACASDPPCVAIVYEPQGGGCFPLSSYASTIAAPNRVFAGAPPPSPTPPPPPPPEWAAAIAAGDMLYSGVGDANLDPSHLPMVGNGFVATQVMSTSLYVAGIFNGLGTKDPSQRARVPATAAVPAPGTPGPAALDVRQATYLRRSFLDPSPAGTCTNASTSSCSNAPSRVWIEQRWYAHRALPSLLVMEVALVAPPPPTGGGGGAPFVVLQLKNEGGGASNDISFSSVPLPHGLPYAIIAGTTHVAETNTSGLESVAVLTSILPPTLIISPALAHATFPFFTLVRTSIETPSPDGSLDALVDATRADWTVASALAANGTLHATHVAEWASTVWTAGFETDRMDVARAVNTSLYAILSSFRNDRPFGLSPGGLTAGYHGHSFWDTER